MSIIFICRKFVEVNVKSKLPSVVNKLKIHTLSRIQLLQLKNKNPNCVHNRNFFNFFKKPKKADLKIIDDVPDQYKIIYRSTLERYILYSQLGITITAVIAFMTVMIMYGSPKGKLIFYAEADIKPTSHENDLQIYVALFVILVVSLQLLIQKMPLRIYYLSQQKKYIFIFPTNIPNSNKKIICNIGDVEKLPLKGIFPWKDAKYKMKNGKSIIMLEENFRKPADLYIMLGLQRDSESDD